jgi:hypothetical protein
MNRDDMNRDDRLCEARLRRRLKQLDMHLERRVDRKFRGEWWVSDDQQHCQTVLRIPLHRVPRAMLTILETWIDEHEPGIALGQRPVPIMATYAHDQAAAIDAEWAAFDPEQQS